MGSNIHLINCSQQTVVHIECIILFKTYPACHLDANGFIPGSGSKMTDKHAADTDKLCVWVQTILFVMYKLPMQQYRQKHQSS